MTTFARAALAAALAAGCTPPPPPAGAGKVTAEQYRQMDGIERGDPYVQDNLDGPPPSVPPQRPGKQVRTR